MKKIITIAALAIAVGGSPAPAAKFCAMQAVKSWSADGSALTWTATMKNDVVISGRYVCASGLSIEAGCANNIPEGCKVYGVPGILTTTNEYSAKPVHDGGIWCWCQVLSPAATGWVITFKSDGWPGGCMGTGGNFGSTYPNCAGICANAIGARFLTGALNVGF